MLSPQRRQAIRDFLQALGLALAVHLGVVLLLVVGTWDWQPFERDTPPVRVTLVDQGPTVAEREAQEQREEEARREEELERQREEAERQRQEELEREREEEAERQRQEEVEREREEAAERERREQERREQARREAEERRQAEEERRQREEERQRELEEIRRQREEARERREEQERRLQELAERREAEEDERQLEEEAERLRLAQEQAAEQARRATLREEYVATIRELVRRNWIRPPTANPGLQCDVKVVQIPGGEIIDATIVSPCNADEASRRSITAAVMRVGELPYRGYEDVFAREIVFTFRYEG